MGERCRRWVGIGLEIGALGMLAMSSGCGVSPCPLRYGFLQNDPAYKDIAGQIYNPTPSPAKVHLEFSQPDGAVLVFHNGARVAIGGETKAVEMQTGSYPFLIMPQEGDRPIAAGALAIYNLDQTVSLATFGKTRDTRLFRDDMLSSAKAGILASYRIKFDEKDVIQYWLGNRTTLYKGGPPTVEVDFSGTPGITLLKIDGWEAKDYVKTLAVPEAGAVSTGGGSCCCLSPVSGRAAPEVSEGSYKIEMTSFGLQYRGYIHNLKANDFTAFVRIPCAIPKELLDAAAGGTVAKYKVLSPGDTKTSLCEIVISGK